MDTNRCHAVLFLAWCRKRYILKEMELCEKKIPGATSRAKALAEVDYLQKLNHPNIISVVEYFDLGDLLYIVMQYADGGDLDAKIHGTKRPFTEKEIMHWVVQIMLALKHVHDRKILHRDIKAQNIFLTKEGTIKLGDFGVARTLENTLAQAQTQIGTPYYLSPEICKNKP